MKLEVYFDKILAGFLERTQEKGRYTYIFSYVLDYLNRGDARPLSVNLPLRLEPYRSTEIFPFFDNLLAEGWLLDVQAVAHKIDKNDKFALISVCGLDCMGAVSLRGETNNVSVS
jgi:serine/threonine-protein kinase HipA